MRKLGGLTPRLEWDIDSREMRSILDATYDGIIAINDKGCIILFNTAAERLLDIPAEDAYGKAAIDIVPEFGLHKVLASGVAELNEPLQTDHIHIIINCVPIQDEKNRIVGAVAAFRDITEVQKLTGEVTCIKETKELLEAIINATQDAISVVDDKERIIIVNPVYTRLIGMTKDEVIGQSPTVDINEGESVHLYVMKTLEAIRGVPLRVGPTRREVLVNAAPIIVNGNLRGSVAVVHDISEIKRLTEELARIKSLVNQSQALYTFEDIIAKDSIMSVALECARRVSTTPVTVLLFGESGTGKELFAHAIHNASLRKNRSFVRVNCAAIPETLMESELFGYEAGAFSGALKSGKKGLFEEANGGTLFLDEIGEISPAIQAKLLRVLQEREIIRVGGVKPIHIDVRIIAATNQNLETAVKRGTFREDLYYRINVIPISIPTLRERVSDLPFLIKNILIKLNLEYGRSVQGISEDSLDILRGYNWPGNVRELENVMGRAIINMRPSDFIIEAEHLPQLIFKMPKIKPPEIVNSLPGRTLQEIIEDAERRAIEAALKQHRGNRVKMARQLGIAVRSLYYKLQRYGIKDAAD